MSTRIGFLLVFLFIITTSALAQTTAFTYQGKLVDNGNLANTAYDMQFKLFDAISGGTQIGATLTFDGTGSNPPAVTVTNGIFAVTLDFGSCSPSSPCFNGSARFLEIAVKPHGSGSYVTLTPRQPITSTPYALKSLTAATATTADGLSAACVNCINVDQIQSVSGSAVIGYIPVSSVPPGSDNYIQNNGHQPFASFDIGGNGHIGNTLLIEGSHIDPPDSPVLRLGAYGIFQIDAPFVPSGRFVVRENGYVGIGIGAPTEKLHVDGNGLFTGSVDAGTHYRIGGLPVFTVNGPYNLIGRNFTATNTFVGDSAGLNTILDPSPTSAVGKFNTFYGAGAGKENIAGIQNTFIGSGADFNVPNPTGDNNTLLGAYTKVNSGVINGTAIGANASVTQSNALVLGSINGVNNAIDDTNIGIGTTAPTERLHVVGNGLFTGNLMVNGTLNASSIAASSVTGVVATANGGTGLSASGAAGNYLRSNGTGWTTSALQAGDLTGTLGTLNGGTGLSNSGVAGNYLRSNGSTWASSALQAGDLTGTLGTANGGTGQSSAGAAGNFLRSNGTAWTSSALQTADIPDLSASYIKNTASTQPSSNFNISGNGVIGNNVMVGNNVTVNGTVSTVGAVGIGTTPAFKLHILDFSNTGLRVQNNTAGGTVASFGSNGDFQIDAPGIGGGRFVVKESGNVGIGTTPTAKLHVSGTGVIRARVDSDSNAGFALTLSNQPKWSVATVTGGNFQIFNDAIGQNAVWIDSATNNVGIGTTSPGADKLVVNGFLRVESLGGAGGQSLCRNVSNQISVCSSSRRYKTNVATLQSGLSLINQLRPVTFEWKANNQHDVGLIAEEVEKVEPLLTFRNEKGEIEGVKYDRVSVVLVNAVKEQQAQIATQQAQLEQQEEQMQKQQREIDDLKRLICLQQPNAEMCKTMTRTVPETKTLRFLKPNR